MSAPIADLSVRVGIDDKTSKGAASVNKRVDGIGKNAGSKLGGGGKFGNIAKSFGEIEKSAARAFGNRSVIAGLGERIGAFRSIGSAIGTGLGRTSASIESVGATSAAATAKLGEATSGLGAASTAAEGLEIAAGAAALTIGGLTIVAAAAAIAGYKIATSWAEGAAEISRLSQRLGIATQDIQAFQAAGERFGISKEATNGALSGFAKTAHDAYYAKNPDARVLLAKIGVRYTKNADGTLDYDAMLKDTARGIAAQHDPMAQSDIADRLGVGGMLNYLRQGKSTVIADNADAKKYAPQNSDADNANANATVYNDAAMWQLVRRQGSRIGAKAAATVAPGLKGLVGAGQSLTDALENPGAATAAAAGLGSRAVSAISTHAAQALKIAGDILKPAAEKLGIASDKLGSVADKLVGAAQAAERKYGVPASVTLGQYGLESGWGKHMPRGSNNPFGIKAKAGEPFVMARTREEDANGNSYYTMAKFRKFNSIDEAIDAHGRLLAGRRYAGARARLPSVDGYADGLTGVYATDHHYGKGLRSMIHDHDLTRFDGGHGTNIKLEIHGLPAGTKVKAKTNRGGVAVSPAMADAH